MIILKKSCVGCKALHNEICELNYKTTTYNILDKLEGIKPIEDCPKPTTINKLVEILIQERQKVNQI
jgi:hypothetical protein